MKPFMLILTVTFLISCSMIGNRTIEITGRVIDKDSGVPLPNISIEAYHFHKWNSFVSKYEPMASATTRENGEFSLLVKFGASIELISLVPDSTKIGSRYRIRASTESGQETIVMKHDRNPVPIIESPPCLLVKGGGPCNEKP
ncbi:carboxypeptidase-like regulatory domain-containing protein [Teredinibacter purpureus]|uniref:carboxypeptidase-like regulatory domain-containing protein n=1 Tax=Teredinibacter purpureus TaxID=2731756 RepID=UPI0005F86844|nr:carboxypeptidase-like regulatory domain-containing protein [Teredinibacter purpureus]